MKATKLIAPNVPGCIRSGTRSSVRSCVVSQVLGTERSHLNPVREVLQADDWAVHRRL